MGPPTDPKIYHIVHVDRLASIVLDGVLWCDTEVVRQGKPGSTIGMSSIKQRRLTNRLVSHQGLSVGDCVPFYFCPRSVMLYVISMQNHAELTYRGGQDPIVHLEADLHETVTWAEQHEHRWAFTLSNAGSRYYKDRCDLGQLDQIDWDAVKARYWRSQTEGKQAEFLIERSFPWGLVRRIGVHSQQVHRRVSVAIQQATDRPDVEIKSQWYY